MDRKLIDACAILLGPQVRRGGQAFLQHLDVAVIRRAYRVLALATHPDAARHGGARTGAADGRRFIEASRAYELLMKYLLTRDAAPAAKAASGSTRRSPAGQGRGTARERASPGGRRATEEKQSGGSGSPRAGGGRKTTGGAKAAAAPLFYHGPVPRRRLRLAEFLYFTGRVSWQSLISALVWQHAARPRFGELAKELHAITAQDLVKILGSKLRHEQTGDTARRLRLLSEAEVARILRLQRARHKPIGRYFVEKERMPTAELSGILRELYRHNARSRKFE